MVDFIKCAVFCYPVAPRVNFSEEIIKYFELLNLNLNTVLHASPVATGQLHTLVRQSK